MKKGLIVLIVVGAAILTAGSAMFGLAIAKGAFKNSSNSKEVPNSITLTESYNKIDVNVATGDLTFKPSEDGKTKVDVIEREKIHFTADVSSDTLLIKQQDDRAFYEKWFGNFGRMKLTVYLPESTYSDLKIKVVSGDVLIQDNFTFDTQNISSTSGDIKLSNINGSSLDIDVTSGDVELTNCSYTGDISSKAVSGRHTINGVTCNKATLNATSGKFDINDLIVSGTFDSKNYNLTIKGVSSDIKFKNCDARNIYMETTSGDIEGNFLTKKSFDADSTTGEVNVDSDRNAEDKCYAHSTTGDIDISIGVK